MEEQNIEDSAEGYDEKKESPGVERVKSLVNNTGKVYYIQGEINSTNTGEIQEVRMERDEKGVEGGIITQAPKNHL